MDDKEQQEYEAAFAEATDTQAGKDSPPAIEEPGEEAADPDADEAGADTPPEESETNPNDEIDWSDPEAAKAAYEAATQERDKLDHQLRSDAGRVTRYQRDRDEAMGKIRLLTDAAKHDNLRGIIDSDEWKTAKETYGDDEFGVILRAIEASVEDGKATQERFAQMGEDELRGFVADNVETLNKSDPEWLNLLTHEQFDSWLEQQPSHVRRLHENNREVLVDPDEVLDLVGKFRSHMGTHQPARQQDNPPANEPPQQPTDQRRAAQLEGSRSAKARTPGVNGQGGDDYEQHFRRAVAAEERAMAHR